MPVGTHRKDFACALVMIPLLKELVLVSLRIAFYEIL